MNPKYRPLVFIGIVFALMAPYLGFGMYYSRKFPPDHWPVWFTNTIAVWFIANFLALMAVTRLMRRLFKNQVVDAEKARAATEIAYLISVPLVILWTLMFLYGTVQTLRGKFALERALPAGAFLLFFIGLFGWGIYRQKYPKKSASG